MNYGTKLSITRNHRIAGNVKAEPTHHVIAHNPAEFKSINKMLQVKPIDLGENTIIAKNSPKLTFKVDIKSDKDSWLVNNISTNLINRMVVKWGENNIILDIERFDLLQTYKDLWLPKNHRQNLIRRGIQSLNLSKLRSGASSGEANETDTLLSNLFGNKYEIPLDYTFLSDQHPFCPSVYNDANRIQMDLYFNTPDLVINSTEPTAKKDYELTNIALEYDTIYEPHLCNNIKKLSESNYYLYDYISHRVKVLKKDDTQFNVTINDKIKSLQGILMLFEVPSTDATRDSEYFYNPDIKKVDIRFDAAANKLFAMGFTPDKFWTEAQKKFMTEAQKINHDSNMNIEKFYNNHFCLWIDTRSTDDNTLHGSGLNLQSEMSIDITKANTGKEVNVHIYLFCDAKYGIINRTVTNPVF